MLTFTRYRVTICIIWRLEFYMFAYILEENLCPGITAFLTLYAVLHTCLSLQIQ